MLALGGGCATPYGSYADDVMQPLQMSALPPLDPNVDASILLDEEVVRFGEDDDGVLVARVFNRTRTRIHRAEGQGWRDAALSYSSTFSKVEAFDVHLTAPDGSARRLDNGIAVDLPSLGDYVLYDDTRVRRLNVPTVSPGTVVERAHILRMTRPELFAFTHVFGDSVPVVRSRFVVEAPPGYVLDTHDEGPGSGAAPVRSERDGRVRLTWESSDVSPVVRDASASWIGDQVRVVSVRLRRAPRADGTIVEGPVDAPELSRVTAALMNGRDAATPGTNAIVKEVLGDNWRSLSERDRAARLYAWTRDSIRYCAVEIGLGGWIPHDAGEVERLRYGDCKDKANLLKALLTAVEVKSRLVTIYSAWAPRPFRLPVVAGNFNHAILVIDLPDGPVFVDPTTRTVAFDDLPPNDEDRECLPIDEVGSPLVRTPASSPAKDVRATTYALQAHATGELGFRGTLTARFEGHFADGLREALLDSPADDHPKVMSRRLGSYFTMEGLKVDGGAPPVFPAPAVVTGNVRFDVDAALGTLWRGSTFLDAQAPTIDDQRTAPLVLPARQRIADELNITLPDGWTVDQLPAPASEDGALLRWGITWTVQGNTVTLRRELSFVENRFDATALSPLRESLKRYFRALEARAVLKKKAPAKEKA
jgi:transglutaminase-like putative cysteine protease